jgi:glutamine synthetase
VGVELGFLATCDLVGLVRGRALKAPVTNSSSVGWVPADLAINSFGSIWEGNTFGSLGDLRLVPVPLAEFHLLGAEGAPNLSVHLSNQTLPDGTLWDYCPRGIAEKALADLMSEFEIDLIASFEHEFLLLGNESRGSAFGLDSFRIAEPFGTQLVNTLDTNGFEPENWLSEYGENQYEITISPSPALTAADRAIALREIARDVARTNGLRASFTPLARPESVGNGVHVHLSLQKNGKPITYDQTQPGNLSKIASCAFNGILKHASAILAWTAPSQISFLRLQPHRWSAGGAYIAVEDREALLRISPLNTVGNVGPGQSFNVEFRAADSTANPWLVIAMLARGLLAGLHEGREIEVIGPLDRPLPRTLNEAIPALLADEVASSWVPAGFLQTHIGIRRSEELELANLSDQEKCERYLNVY